MSKNPKECQYRYNGLVEVSSPDTRSALPLRRYWWNIKNDVWHLRVFGANRVLN
jgi:hypothetical protein